MLVLPLSKALFDLGVGVEIMARVAPAAGAATAGVREERASLSEAAYMTAADGPDADLTMQMRRDLAENGGVREPPRSVVATGTGMSREIADRRREVCVGSWAGVHTDQDGRVDEGAITARRKEAAANHALARSDDIRVRVTMTNRGRGSARHGRFP